MNKFKKNKGITLVALIITVVILLILAVVSIRAVTGDCKGISTSSNAYNAIFLKSDGTSKDYYWLGTSYASTDVSCVFYID